jgi:hypothetical protein
MFFLHSLVQHEMLQFILDPGPYLHQFVTVHQQLAMIPHPGVWYPDAWKPPFDQQLQYVFCISSIRFLLPYIAGPDLCRVPNPYLVPQLLQQLHEPLIVSYSLDANDRWRRQFSIEVFGFSARVRQLVFFGRSSLGIEHSDLLKTRVKITTYYDHPDSFLTLALVSKPDTVYELRQSLRPYLISLFVEASSRP